MKEEERENRRTQSALNGFQCLGPGSQYWVHPPMGPKLSGLVEVPSS